MISVKVAEFRNQLSRYLGKVRQGAEVVIKDRNTPVGRLIPYDGSKEREESFDMIPPRKNGKWLARMAFTPVKIDYDIVEDLMADRKKDALLR